MDPIELIMRRIGVKGDGLGPTIANSPRWYRESQDPETARVVDKAMHGNVRNTPWLEQLYKSGLADTLYKATGRVPSRLGAADDTKNVAFVNPFGGVYMNPDRKKYDNTIGIVGRGDPEMTFAHEMGHLYRPPKNMPPMKTAEPALWAMDKRKGNPKYWRDGAPSPYAAAIEKVDPYYRKSEDEAVSQAFSNAIKLLRSGDTTNVRSRMGEMEAQTPGMGVIARDLLQKPVFSNSPFRRVIR